MPTEQRTRASPHRSTRQGHHIRCPECSLVVERISRFRADGTARVGPCNHIVPVEVTLG